jgi:hypothetical protein
MSTTGRALHVRTAQAIKALYHERLDDHYSDLARHYRRRGNIEKAVEDLHRAGQQAVQRSAHAEAINHLTTLFPRPINLLSPFLHRS